MSSSASGRDGLPADCREPARAAMLERLAQRAEVFARLAFEPLGETPVQRSPRLSGKLRQGRRSDEVVGRLQRRTRIEHDTAGNEVCGRRDDSLGRPFGQRGRLGHGQRTTRNDKESEQPADVRTGATQPSAYKLLRGSLGACCSGEDSEPERRAVGLLPDLCRRGDVPPRARATSPGRSPSSRDNPSSSTLTTRLSGRASASESRNPLPTPSARAAARIVSLCPRSQAARTR